MAFPCALLPPPSALRDRSQVHGGIRNAGNAPARRHSRKRSGTLEITMQPAVGTQLAPSSQGWVILWTSRYAVRTLRHPARSTTSSEGHPDSRKTPLFGIRDETSQPQSKWNQQPTILSPERSTALAARDSRDSGRWAQQTESKRQRLLSSFGDS